MTSPFLRVLPAALAALALVCLTGLSQQDAIATWRPSMPAAPLETTIAPPSIKGVTTTDRANRLAAETPPSAETLARTPGASDIAAALGLGEPAPADEEEASTDTGTEQTQEETQEIEEIPAAPVEEETTEETEEEPSAEELTPEAAAIRTSMQKRIDKLTAQRTDAEKRAAAIEAELEQLRQNATRPVAAPTAEQPLAHIESEKDLDALIAEAQQSKLWALRHRHGGEVLTKEGSIAYTGDEVAEILANAEAQLAAAPQRREWLQQQQQYRSIAQQHAPEFYQAGHPAQQILQKEMASIPPAVRAWRPDVELLLVQAMLGHRMMLEKHNKGQTHKPSQPPKAPPAPTARIAPKAPIRVIAARQAEQRLATIGKGTEAELADVLAARLKL